MSSLSNEAVQERIGKYFVPVWVSRDQYQLDARSTAEHKEILRVDRAAKEAKLPGGAVAVFVIAPDGKVLASQNLKEAIDPKKLVAMLDEVIEKHKLTERKADAIKASKAEQRPLYRRSADDAAIFHVMTRFDERRKHYGVSEDWLELTAAEWKKLLPPDSAKRGDTYDIPEKAADKMVRTFYPPGPNWRLEDSEVKAVALKGRLIWRSQEGVVFHVTGQVEVSHPFGKDAPGTTTAKVAAIVQYHPGDDRLTRFELVSTEASYAWLWKGKPQPEKVSIGVELEK